MSKLKVNALCRTAVMVAMYVLLNLISIRAGNLRITFASLPVVTASLLFGPLEGGLVALLGEFLNQLLSFGLTPTTLIWVLPPVARGLVIGTVAVRMWREGRLLDRRPAVCYAVCLLGAAATTLCNTAAIWMDSVIYGYYTFLLVFGDALLRFATGMVTAVVITTVAIPLVHLLRRGGMAGAVY